MGLSGVLKSFFVEQQPTVEMAYDKAKRAGWQIEQRENIHIVHGVNPEGQPDTWQFQIHETPEMNWLLDHHLSVQIGEEYRLATYGPDEPTDSNEAIRRRHKIRDYRLATYHNQEYKPGWKRLLRL